MIENIILISAWCWGVHCLFNEDYILGGIGLVIERTIGTTLCKPLFLCPPCMSSIHGFAWALYFYGLDFKIIPFVIALTGLNYVIKTFVYPEYIDESP